MPAVRNMEQPTAILIADLSGYTALTETHGSHAAADLIDQFIGIVDQSLIGDCALHQIVGDEVLLISESPDHLLSTTRSIRQQLCDRHHFLQLHGGLHYGQLLKRKNSYFGTALNLASRMANLAGTGSILCSEDFKAALNSRSAVQFKALGRHTFKNLSEEKELFELTFGNFRSVHIDPVCRMIIRHPESAITDPMLEGIFFCSEKCRSLYMKSTNA